MNNLLERIQNTCINLGQLPPENEDTDIIMSILMENENAISSGVTPADAVHQMTGIPYLFVEQMAEKESMTLASKALSPFGERHKTGDETTDTIMLYLVSFIQGFTRGITLRRNQDLEEVIKESDGFEEAIESVLGGVDRASVEWGGKMTAIRMKAFVDQSPPENEIWPHMSQWYDGFIVGWSYVNAKAVRNVGL